MAEAPKSLENVPLDPSTITKFKSVDKDVRLAAGEDLLRAALRNNEAYFLARLDYEDGERPYVAAVLRHVHSGHSGSTETGWEYRDRQDIRRNKDVAYLNSPKPGMAELVGHMGKNLAPDESVVLSRILGNSGSAEVARLYVLDRSFWNPDKLVTALTAEMKRPPLGVRSTDQRGGGIIKALTYSGQIGSRSARMEDQYAMVVDVNVPGNARINTRFNYLADLPGGTILVGRTADQRSR